MKAEELAMIINEIDEDMVEDAWTENGMSIIISERSPLSFWKIAAATAACFAAVIAGVFCFTKMKPDDITPPNESTYTSKSSDPTDEVSQQDFPDFLAKEGEENRILFDEEHTDTEFYAEKFNNRNYVQLNIEETNASEDRPVYIVIYDAAPLLNNKNALVPLDKYCISEVLKITGPGQHAIEYLRERGIGALNCLNIECSPGDYDGLILKGNWIP